MVVPFGYRAQFHCRSYSEMHHCIRYAYTHTKTVAILHRSVCVCLLRMCSPLCVKCVCLERCILYERENEVESLSIVCTMRTAVPIEAQTNEKIPDTHNCDLVMSDEHGNKTPAGTKQKWKAVHQRLTQTAVYVRFDFSFRRIPLVSLTTADRH